MSMSTHVVGFRPPDEKWRKMKAAYDACQLAGISIPDEVDEYFNGETPDEAGVEVEIDSILEEWGDDSRQGYQIDITKLPKDVKILRFYNSW